MKFKNIIKIDDLKQAEKELLEGRKEKENNKIIS
jgi:hypothetical protein